MWRKPFCAFVAPRIDECVAECLHVRTSADQQRHSRRERTIQRFILLTLLWLCGACLRLTILAVPPVVPLLHADLHLSETGLGWLSSLPPMLFALAAVPG